MKLRLTAQAGLLTASRASGQILNALLGIVVVRHLSKVEYGTFRQIYLMAATLIQAELGFTESLYFFIPSFPQLKAVFLRQSVLIVGSVQILIGALFLTFPQIIANFFHNPQLLECIDLLVLYSGFTVVTRIWEVELVADRRTPYAALVAGVSEALKVGLALIAIAISAGIRPLLWALVIATGLKFVAFAIFLVREFHLFASAGPLRNAFPQFRYAISLWIPGVLSGVIGAQAHQYIVGHYFAPAEYAIYAVACFQVPFVTILSTSMSEVFLVRMTEYCAQGRKDDIYNLWTNACRKALLVLVAIVAVVVVLAQPIIVVLFTEQYRESAPLFAIMVLVFLFNGVFQDSLFRAYSAMKVYASYNILRAGLGLVLGLVGVKYWGLMGAALSIVISLAIVNALQLISCAQLMEISMAKVLPWKDILKITGVALISALVTKALLLLHMPSKVSLVVGFSAFGIIYPFLALRCGLLSADELHFFIEETKNHLGRVFWVPRKEHSTTQS